MKIKSEPEEEGIEMADSIGEGAAYIKSEIQEQTQSDTRNNNVNVKNEILKSNECNICLKSFTVRSRLKSHMRTHSGERPYNCDICPKSFSHNGSLKTHIKSKHTKEKEFKCDQCDYATSRIGVLKLHKRIHTGEGFKCETCAKVFTTRPILKQHILSHTDERNFQCDNCGLAFRRKSTLKVHKRVHTGERPFKCDECPETFTGHSTLVQHKGSHRGVADFKCDICPKTFLSRFSLRNHKDTHKEEPEECPKCGKILKNKRRLYAHTKNLHPKDSKHRVVYENMVKKFGCKMCEKAFERVASLQAHMKIHTGEKPYACDQCPKAFTKSCNLKVHLTIHSGEKPYKCTECHKGFRELFPLKKHMLKIHGIEYKRTNTSKSKHPYQDPLPSHPGLPPLSEKSSHSPLKPPLSSEKTKIESPPLETQLLDPLSPTPQSEKKLSEPLIPGSRSTKEEFKGLSTIPCAKESLFSKIDGNYVENGRIKIEPIECNVDEFGQENIKTEAPEVADGREVKIECEEVANETGENPQLYFECEETDIIFRM